MTRRACHFTYVACCLGQRQRWKMTNSRHTSSTPNRFFFHVFCPRNSPVPEPGWVPSRHPVSCVYQGHSGGVVWKTCYVFVLQPRTTLLWTILWSSPRSMRRASSPPTCSCRTRMKMRTSWQGRAPRTCHYARRYVQLLPGSLARSWKLQARGP